MNYLEYLRTINFVSICLRIFLAVLIGGILGLERGRKNRPAGFRTYMLVCMGAAMVMMTNQFIFQTFHVSDPVRMGAQVVSGIGFLGAGTIITTGKVQVKGITTAAGLWASACSGLAIGSGFYEGALIYGIGIYLVMVSMQRIDMYIHNHSTHLEVYLECRNGFSMKDIIEFAQNNQFDVSDIQFLKAVDSTNTMLSVRMTIKSIKKRTHEQMVDVLSQSPAIRYLQEL